MFTKLKPHLNNIVNDYLQDNMPESNLLFVLSGLLMNLVAIGTCVFGIISYPSNVWVFILESCFILYVGRTCIALSCTIYAKLRLPKLSQ